MKEKEALTAHVSVLTQQNCDLSKELAHFVQQDECLRNQLDRRCRVEGIEKKNHAELAASNTLVQEARQNSPTKCTPVIMQRSCSPVRYVTQSYQYISPCRSPVKYC